MKLYRVTFEDLLFSAHPKKITKKIQVGIPFMACPSAINSISFHELLGRLRDLRVAPIIFQDCTIYVAAKTLIPGMYSDFEARHAFVLKLFTVSSFSLFTVNGAL